MSVGIKNPLFKPYRGPRMTLRQKVFLVNFMDKNREMVFYQKSPTLEMDIEMKWRELVRNLNKPTLGPPKTVAQWKDTFGDFKCSIRKKSRILQANKNSHLNVSNIEFKFMELMNLYVPPANRINSHHDFLPEIIIEDQNSCETTNLETTSVNSVVDKDSTDPLEDHAYSIIAEDENNSETVKIEFIDSVVDDNNADPLGDLEYSNDNDVKSNEQKENIQEKEDNGDQDTDKSQKEFIDRQRQKIEERLRYKTSPELAKEIENHTIEMQNLASTFEKQAEALVKVARAFENFSSAMERMTYKLKLYFER